MNDNIKKARELMQRSRSQGFAVGAFNVDNQETLIAIAQAAQAKNSPVMVEVSQGEVDTIGLDNIRDLVDNYKADLGIEMYINLDHSPSVEAAKAGIDAGFEFIHIDVSQANHDATWDEIVAATKEVVEYAREKSGALVESEEHYFAGSSNVHTETIDYEEIKKYYTDPKQAVEFVNQTGIDTFAASVGNLHGKYPVPKILDLDLLQQVRDALDCNISLHGGSDTPSHFFKSAAKIGVNKVNLNTDMRVAFRDTLEKQLKENPTEYAVPKLEGPVIAAVQKVVEEHIDLYGSAGKAQP